jgi:hypothetical protein
LGIFAYSHQSIIDWVWNRPFTERNFTSPKVIEELKLRDGDKVEYRLLGSDVVELKIERKRSSKQILLDEIRNPQSLGIKRTLKRRTITKILIDTNVVACAHDRDSLNHPLAFAVMGRALSGKFEGVLSIQNISEPYSVPK